MVRPEDWELEPPVSLREIVRDELIASNYDDFRRHKEVKPVTDEAVDQLMQLVYERIEKEALAVYHSNEPWALKAWAYSTILKDAIIADEVSQSMVENLVSPVVEWQDKQPFDPVKFYRERLAFERKSERTIECYMLTAARFVARIGRKRHYTDEDVESYLQFANKHYKNQHSYYQECQRLLQFLRRLPGADKKRELPIKMPKMPDEFYQPTFSKEEVETLIWATVIDNIPASMVVRLLVASVYGARRSELSELTSEDIHLDGATSTIFIRTKKGGQKKPQPIPRPLVPLLAVPIDRMHGHTIQRQLKRICKRAGVRLPFRGGYHSFRRSVVTAVSEVEPSDLSVSNFMRWAGPGRYSMLARYRQTPVEVTDKAILDKHPYVKIWEEAAPYLLKFNSSYLNIYPPNDKR
jgi:integrase